MAPVHGKIMSSAMISASCAHLLSDIGAKPGTIQSGGALTRSGHQRIVFTSRSDYSWSDTAMSIRPAWLLAGALQRDKGANRATLDLESKWFRFRESKNGFSTLTLWDVELPMSICSGVRPDRYRLLDLVDLSKFKPIFIVRSNPKVHALKNVVRLRRHLTRSWPPIQRRPAKALLVTMRDDWSRGNWGFWSSENGYRSTMDNP